MKKLIYTALPMVISMLLSNHIYSKYNKKYNITNKIYWKLPIQNKWIGIFTYIITIIIVSILMLINTPNIICYVFAGVMTGIIIGITSGFNINTTYIKKK